MDMQTKVDQPGGKNIYDLEEPLVCSSKSIALFNREGYLPGELILDFFQIVLLFKHWLLTRVSFFVLKALASPVKGTYTSS